MTGIVSAVGGSWKKIVDLKVVCRSLRRSQRGEEPCRRKRFRRKRGGGERSLLKGKMMAESLSRVGWGRRVVLAIHKPFVSGVKGKVNKAQGENSSDGAGLRRGREKNAKVF